MSSLLNLKSKTKVALWLESTKSIYLKINKVSSANKLIGVQEISDFLKFIYDYKSIEFDTEDFQKRKRIKIKTVINW